MSATGEQVEVVDATPVFDVVPYTGRALANEDGEAVTLTQLTDAQLAAVIDEAKEFALAQLTPFQRAAKDEALRRMDGRAAAGEDGAWTIHAGEWKLTGDSPDRTEYPVDDLRTVLKGLADAKLIDAAAIDKVIVVDKYKVAKRPLTQLLKVSQTVKDAILAVERPVEKSRNVTVTREVR